MSYINGQSSQPTVAVNITGNTSGVTANISSGTLTLAGGNNVTLSQAGNAITIDGAASYPGFAANIGGNTAGATSNVTAGTLTLAGGNNVTLSQAGNAITIDASSPPGLAVNIGGNTSGATANVSSGTLLIAGGSNITISQNASTITIIGPSGGATIKYWDPSLGEVPSTPGVATLTNTPNRLQIAPVYCYFNITPDRLQGAVNLQFATNTSGSQSLSFSSYLGVYTLNNGTLSLYSSVSSLFTLSNSSNANLSLYDGGMRVVSIPFTGSFAPGMYWIAGMTVSSTSFSNAGGVSIAPYIRNILANSSEQANSFGVASNITSRQWMPGMGYLSVTTSAFPASINFSDLVGVSTNSASPIVRNSPWVQFYNGTV